MALKAMQIFDNLIFRDEKFGVQWYPIRKTSVRYSGLIIM